jgi:hypothetical protein
MVKADNTQSHVSEGRGWACLGVLCVRMRACVRACLAVDRKP